MNHRMMVLWENQHTILLSASAEWLLSGTFAGRNAGSFTVGVDGRVSAQAK
jgi:hypothetical protein